MKTNTPINITEDALKEAARKYSKVIKSLPMIVLQDTLQYVTTISGVQGDLVLSNLKAKGSWASYRKNRDEDNSAAVGGRILHTDLLSLEMNFDPNTVAGKLENMRPNVGDTLANLPLVAQILAQVVLEASDELNSSIFTAAKNAESGFTPSTAIDGWDTIAAQEVTKSNISEEKGNLIDAGSNKLNESNTFDFINYVYLSLSEKLKKSTEPILFYVSPNVLSYYNAGYLASVGSVVYNKQYNQPEILGSNGRAVIVPLASKAGSNMIQVTTKSNMIFGTSDPHDMDKLTVKVPELWDVLLGGTMWAGCQYEFIDPEKFTLVKFGGTAAPTNPFA